MPTRCLRECRILQASPFHGQDALGSMGRESAGAFKSLIVETAANKRIAPGSHHPERSRQLYSEAMIELK
jgi:hypothetical protein